MYDLISGIDNVCLPRFPIIEFEYMNILNEFNLFLFH